MNEDDILKSLDARYGRCKTCNRWINKDIYLKVQTDQDIDPVIIFHAICFRCAHSQVMNFSYRQKSRLFSLANLYDYEASKDDVK